MTLGQARAATSPELALYRTPGKWSRWRAAIFSPTTIYTARVNQTFSSYDQLLQITYDGGSGTLADVKADMMLLVGSSAGAYDKGITRVRSIDATKIYIGETSDIEFADNDYLTIVDDFGLWARHVKITAGVTYMDGTTAYTDQHSKPDPVPVMGSHRILELTGLTVSTTFDGSASYVVGGLSSITGYAWSAPTASASSGMTTATPTITFDTPGKHAVYLTVTAANGKTFTGVRYVYVWDSDHLPPRAQIGNCRIDAETGGWSCDLTLFGNCTLADIRERALVVIFSQDHFGTTQQDIGPVAGSENVELVGWISDEEEIDWHPEQGTVKFNVQGAHYWFAKIPSFPDGVRFKTGTPASWTDIQNLTVDKGLWHFLHWRTTATRIMDVFLTSDTKYTKEVSSLASNLWKQIREMSWSQIYARSIVNAQGQLFVEVHPQLVAEASRSWASVLTITKKDWQGDIKLRQITAPQAAIVSLSGVAVNSSGTGSAYFALSPGHSYPHYGDIDLQDRLLVSGQADANQKAGLYRGWRNNPLPDVEISFTADIRLIDCAPRQKCAIVLATGDTERGIAYTGDLVPKAVTVVMDPKTGHVHREVVFEAASVEDLAINGDIPGSRADSSIPPLPKFPSLPIVLPSILPGLGDVTDGGPKKLLFVEDSHGLLYSENFYEEDTKILYGFVNAGIDPLDLPHLCNFHPPRVFITPNGAVYMGIYDYTYDRYITKVWRAPYLGGTFVKVIDQDWIDANEGVGGLILGMGYNPTKPEEVALIVRNASSTGHFWIGSNTTWTQKVELSLLTGFTGNITFGYGKWIFDGQNPSDTASAWWRFASDGSALELTTDSMADTIGFHVRAGTSAKIYKISGANLFSSVDNGTNLVTTPVAAGFHDLDGISVTPDGMYMMANWDLTAKKGRSSDGGTSWAAIPNLVPGGDYSFQWAGGEGLSSRWIAAVGAIWYSDNFGEAWVQKLGNILSLIPAGMVIRKIIVVEP